LSFARSHPPRMVSSFCSFGSLEEAIRSFRCANCRGRVTAKAMATDWSFIFAIEPWVNCGCFIPSRMQEYIVRIAIAMHSGLEIKAAPTESRDAVVSPWTLVPSRRPAIEMRSSLSGYQASTESH